MPMRAQNSAAARAALAARVLGYFVFLVAFFLPACREVATAGAGDPGVYKGYFCAWVTLINTFNGGVWRSKDFLAILSGWINPLMLLYVAFVFSSKLRRARRFIGVVIVLFIVCTWIYFFLFPLVPLVGHFLWVAGILLILSSDVFVTDPQAVMPPPPPPLP
jgi:hypothetical protein